MKALLILDNEKIEQCIVQQCSYQPYDIRFSVCSNSKNFKRYIDDDLFDFIFVRMEMEVDGFYIAKYISENPFSTKIIFISDRMQLSYDVFAYTTYFYIRLSYLDIDLKNLFKKISNDYISHKSLLIENHNSKNLILISEIIYILNDRNYVLIITSNETYRVRETLKNILSNPLFSIFVEINKGVLVNMKKVKSVNDCAVLLSNDTTLYISKSRKKLFILKLTEYIRMEQSV